VNWAEVTLVNNFGMANGYYCIAINEL